MKASRTLLAVAILAAVSFGCEKSAPPAPASTESTRMPQTYSGPTREVLAAGEVLPPLECEGWLNGPPAAGSKLRLVDVWSAWCPECRAMAPNLVLLHAKYRDRGVEFVSVTDITKTSTEGFVQQFAIPWPCGYGLPAETVVRLGAVNKSMAAVTPGYLVAPTMYLVGADGKVRWSDGSARWKHKKPDEIRQLIEDALEAALK